MTNIELITLIAAIGAVAAAIAAWRAAYEAKKALQTQVIMNITDAYATPEMLDAMKELREFEREHNNKFADKFLEERNKGSDTGNHLDHCRRIIISHFLKIVRMKKLKLVDDSFVKEVAHPTGVQFLFEVIEPLERIINPNYDISVFDMFRKLYPDLSKAGRVA